MHFVKHLSTSIMNFNDTISRGGGGGRANRFQGGEAPPAPPRWNPAVYTSLPALLVYPSLPEFLELLLALLSLQPETVCLLSPFSFFVHGWVSTDTGCILLLLLLQED